MSVMTLTLRLRLFGQGAPGSELPRTTGLKKRSRLLRSAFQWPLRFAKLPGPFDQDETFRPGSASCPDNTRVGAGTSSAASANKADRYLRGLFTAGALGCTDQQSDVKILLANSEPSTHGTSRTFRAVRLGSENRGTADMLEPCDVWLTRAHKDWARSLFRRL